jgi:hypothetical protein
LPTETKKKANKTKQQSHNPNPRQDVLGQKNLVFSSSSGSLGEASDAVCFFSFNSSLGFLFIYKFSSLEGRKGEEALASREGEKYAIDGGAIEGNGAIAASAATSLVIEDEEVETKKKKKQDLVFDSVAPAGGSRSLWKTDQKEQHGGPSLKDRFVSNSCCSPFADATES